MCRYAELTLAPDTRASAAARTWLRERLGDWDLSDAAADLQVVISELVTNAVLHARSAVDLTISVGEGVIELSVADSDPRLPQPRVASEVWDEGGRGLMLVSELSDEWGVAHHTHGKQIWIRVPAPNSWPFAKGCLCSHDPDEAQRVASGRRIVDMLH